MGGGTIWLGLVRGIGPASHRAMPLRALRDRCEEAGLGEVQSLLATGNLLFRSDLPEAGIGEVLDRVIRSFGLDNPVILRRPGDLAGVVARGPFPEAAAERPAQMLVQFLPGVAPAGAEAMLRERAGPEQVRVAGREVYIDYRAGVGRSALSPAFLERALGQSGTARNWNTLLRLLEAARARAEI